MEKLLILSSPVKRSGKKGHIKISIHFMYATCVLLLVSGCAVFSKSTNGRFIDPFAGYAEYAETVFKRQNHATSEIMMLSEDDMDPDMYNHLLEAEKRMQAACELLNEYAIREIDGKYMSLFFKKKVQNSVEGCENALRNVESRLAKLNPFAKEVYE